MIFVEATVTRFPRDNYDNETMIEALAPYRRRLEAASMSMPAFNDAFFQALGVRSRGLFCDPFAPERWFDENAGQYPVAREAAWTYLDLMAEREPLGADDKVIVITNTIDTPAPNVGYAMLAHLRRMVPGFVAPLTVSLSGEGCSGYISGLREADQFLRAFPQRRAVVVTVELMGTFLWHPGMIAGALAQGTAKMARGLAIQRLLFGDGCSATYITADGPGRRLQDFRRWDNLAFADLHLLEASNTGTQAGPFALPHGLFSQQPVPLLRRLVEEYLPHANAALREVPERPQSFAVHTGSRKILGAVQSAIGLTDEETAPSAHVLARHGNMNSTTGAAVMAAAPPKARIFCVFFGVGFSLQTAA